MSISERKKMPLFSEKKYILPLLIEKKLVISLEKKKYSNRDTHMVVHENLYGNLYAQNILKLNH